jgi:hypothetical protein
MDNQLLRLSGGSARWWIPRVLGAASLVAVSGGAYAASDEKYSRSMKLWTQIGLYV